MGILNKLFGSYSDRELKMLQKEAAEVFPETVLTRDRMVFDIPLKD